MAQKPVLEIFSDYVWPWCYFITGRIEKLQNNFDIQIIWRAFPLHPDIPEQGITLEELFQKKKMDVDVDRVMAHLKKTAAAEGLAMGDRRKTFNSRLAQEAGLWAQSLGKGHAFHTAAFQAYFVDGRNLARKEVLMDLVCEAGLDPDAGEKVIDERLFSTAVDTDWALSRQKQVTAVPTFIMGLEKLVGAQPYLVLEKMVSRNMG